MVGLLLAFLLLQRLGSISTILSMVGVQGVLELGLEELSSQMGVVPARMEGRVVLLGIREDLGLVHVLVLKWRLLLSPGAHQMSPMSHWQLLGNSISWKVAVALLPSEPPTLVTEGPVLLLSPRALSILSLVLLLSPLGLDGVLAVLSLAMGPAPWLLLLLVIETRGLLLWCLLQRGFWLAITSLVALMLSPALAILLTFLLGLTRLLSLGPRELEVDMAMLGLELSLRLGLAPAPSVKEMLPGFLLPPLLSSRGLQCVLNPRDNGAPHHRHQFPWAWAPRDHHQSLRQVEALLRPGPQVLVGGAILLGARLPQGGRGGRHWVTAHRYLRAGRVGVGARGC